MALRGLIEESLRVIDETALDQGPAGKPASSAADLLRARLLLARDGPQDVENSKKILGALAEGGGDASWRAGIELARPALAP